MRTLAPPPLPDVPPPLPTRAFAYASAPVPAVHEDAWRPVGSFTRLCLYTPLPVTLVAAALMLLKEYASGADFRHDSTHALVRMFDLIVFAAAGGVALFISAVIFLSTFRRLEPAVRWKVGARIGLALSAGALSAVMSEAVFQWGKSRAYAAVNPAALTADCATIAAAPQTYATSSAEYTYEAKSPLVPAYTRSTGAKWVRVAPAGVSVIMSVDLFAGVHEEGLFVPASPAALNPQAYAAQNGMTVLTTNPPVFRYAR